MAAQISAHGEPSEAHVWRSRIAGHGEARPTDLVPNARNWRTHPAAQRAALGGVLDDVGRVQQVVVNRRTGHLVDGHLRVALAQERRELAVPVTFVDLSEKEEALVLATLDPVAAMATADAALLKSLLSGGPVPVHSQPEGHREAAIRPRCRAHQHARSAAARAAPRLPHSAADFAICARCQRSTDEFHLSGGASSARSSIVPTTGLREIGSLTRARIHGHQRAAYIGGGAFLIRGARSTLSMSIHLRQFISTSQLWGAIIRFAPCSRPFSDC